MAKKTGKTNKSVKRYWWIVLVAIAIWGAATGKDLPTGTEGTTPTPTLTMAVEDTQPTKPAEPTKEADPTTAMKPTATGTPRPTAKPGEVTTDFSVMDITLADIPAYTTEAYCVINDNVPFFVVDKSMVESYEFYSELDAMGRCGVVHANIGRDIMPTEERGSIGSVKPTGWQTAKYDCVDGKYLYNRCHLIGFQLTGENANRKNLITGTRYMNVDGMLPFENMVADYVKETGNHVMYRVYPMFDGDNLVATGALMEAWSVEDEGEGICFNVFVYNIQPGVAIDYATGNSRLESEDVTPTPTIAPETTYVLNTSSKKFHYPDCGSVSLMAEKNKQEVTWTREEAVSNGYAPCGSCKP